MDFGQRQGASRRLLFALFAVVFVSYGYFYQSGQDNENARFAQIRGLVDYRSVAIPPQLHNSADVIVYEGRVYPNKAPGASLIGAPSYWLSSRLLGLAGLSDPLRENLIWHLTVWTTLGMVSALLAVFVYRLLEQTLDDPFLALFVTLAYAIGTIAFPFSTVFFSHQLAAALAFFCFGLVFLLRAHRKRPDAAGEPAHRRPPAPLLLLAGFCGGFALTTEYPALLAVAPIGLYALVTLREPRSLLYLAIGVGVGGGFLVAYNLLAFGKIYMIPYSVYAESGGSPFPDHKLGYMGVKLPSWEVLKAITVRPMRGLFYVNPWLALIVPGLLVPLLFRGYRREWSICALVVAVFFAFNAGYGDSFVYWGGGASVGPRHIIPMLPFAALLVAPLLHYRLLRWIFYPAALASVAIMLMATATEPRVPYAYPDPLKDLFWDSYLRGRLAMHHFGPFSSIPVTSDSVSFNLGKLFGLPRNFQLLPLLVFWFVMFAALVSLASRRAAAFAAARRAVVDAPGAELPPPGAAPLPPGPESPAPGAESPPRGPAPRRRWLPVSVVGCFLLVLFALPFWLGPGEIRPGEEGNGLRGTYVEGKLWDGLSDTYEPPEIPAGARVLTRIDRYLFFPWQEQPAPIDGSFSVEWTGWIHAPVSGLYKFATESDDGSSVYVDGRLVLDNWGGHPRRWKYVDVTLERGLHPLVVRYYNVAHAGLMYFYWARPGQHLQTVPEQYLFPERPAVDPEP